jgi:hypothetical protein
MLQPTCGRWLQSVILARRRPPGAARVCLVAEDRRDALQSPGPLEKVAAGVSHVDGLPVASQRFVVPPARNRS